MNKEVNKFYDYPSDFYPFSYFQNPEEFIQMPDILSLDFENYLISNYGRVYNKKLDSYVPKSLIPSHNRYILVMLKDINGNNKTVGMHNLVALTFIGTPPIIPGSCVIVNHKDGVKWHNEPYNLEWITQSENMIHADKNNLIAKACGETNGWSNLTDDQYREICRLTQEGYLPNQINKIMNLDIDITNITQKIRKGSSGSIIAKEFDFSNIPTNDYKKFSDEQVEKICWYLQEHPEYAPIDILKILGYDIDNMDFKAIKKLRDTISTIKRRKCYNRISDKYNF